MEKTTNTAKPFLKWAGGKRQLIDRLKPLFPKDIENYYEPFLGGGAVFFNMDTPVAHLNDLNEDLILTYKAVKDNVEALIQEVQKYPTDKETYYAIRELDRDPDKFKQLSDVQRAARLIYLNKLCYSGLFRVNARNEFNVAYAGYKNPTIINEEGIRKASEYMNTVEVHFYNEHYDTFLENVEPGSFVFLNPPHEPRAITENYTTYYHEGFSSEEQKQVKECCDMLNERGVKFLLLNNPTQNILTLYKEYKPKLIPTRNYINNKGRNKRPIYEAFVRNYE